MLGYLRRVPSTLGHPEGRRGYVRVQNFIGKTTAAGPLPSATSDYELNRRRQTPSTPSHSDEDSMIVPSRTHARTHLSDTTRRDFTPAVSA